MIPLKDDVPSRSLPLVTIALIVLNVLAFLYKLSLGFDVRGPEAGAAEALVNEFGLVPCRLTESCPIGFGRLGDDFPSPVATIFTSMFLHGGVLHVGGNMLYLWIFGDNLEDTLGHARFLFFYLTAGVAAVLSQTLVTPSSTLPMIGASGAVSGVLGAYLLLFPHASVYTLITFGFFVKVPALIVLGFWIVLQLLNGYLTISAHSFSLGETGGVAWFAHIGGFLAGMLLLFLLRPRQSRRL